MNIKQYTDSTVYEKVFTYIEALKIKPCFTKRIYDYKIRSIFKEKKEEYFYKNTILHEMKIDTIYENYQFTDSDLHQKIYI